MEFIKKNALYIILGGLVLAVLGEFLPFYKISLFGISVSVKFFEAGQGKIALIAFAAAGVLVFLKKEKIALAPMAAGLALTIWNMIDVSKDSAGVGSLAIGAYLCLIGAAAALAVTLLKLKK